MNTAGYWEPHWNAADVSVAMRLPRHQEKLWVLQSRACKILPHVIIPHRDCKIRISHIPTATLFALVPNTAARSITSHPPKLNRNSKPRFVAAPGKDPTPTWYLVYLSEYSEVLLPITSAPTIRSFGCLSAVLCKLSQRPGC